jgi:organic hydroperoxide reductase OsmC/OhrA
VARTETYHTDVVWQGEHLGQVTLGNGPQMEFSAPPQAHGRAGVLTPEDAFVAAANTCIMLMFLWACERFKLDLVHYSCRAEGTKEVAFDLTETFTHVRLWPQITVRAAAAEVAAIEARVQRALAAAQKYSLVANSLRSQVIIEPQIIILKTEEEASA